MSTATQQLTLSEAMFAAAKFQALFDPATYERWTVAGSVRRQRPEVGDIEHVIIPRFGDRPSADLFATPTRTNLVLARMDELVTGGTIARHVYPNGTVRWGERYRGCSFAAPVVNTHEVFFADWSNFGSALAIRTGPAEFSKSLVTNLRRNSYRNKDGYVWRCDLCGCAESEAECKACDGTGLVPVERVSVPDEQTFFKLAGMAYVPPERRVA